jgi:hypothetical protein
MKPTGRVARHLAARARSSGPTCSAQPFFRIISAWGSPHFSMINQVRESSPPFTQMPLRGFIMQLIKPVMIRFILPFHARRTNVQRTNVRRACTYFAVGWRGERVILVSVYSRLHTVRKFSTARCSVVSAITRGYYRSRPILCDHMCEETCIICSSMQHAPDAGVGQGLAIHLAAISNCITKRPGALAGCGVAAGTL